MTTISEIPIFAILLILEHLASTNFVDFFNIFKTWSATQRTTTIRDTFTYFPVEELYTWGRHSNITARNMLLQFMQIAGSYGSNKAIFYVQFRIVLQRDNELFGHYNQSYGMLRELSGKNHILSKITINVLDIYYFPGKRQDAITELTKMTRDPTITKAIPRMIQML